MKKRISIICAALISAVMLSLAGCSQQEKQTDYKDGVYTGKSSVHQSDEDGNGSGYGETEIEIKNNKIVSCTFTTYEPDGTLKDESYGSEFSKENRLKAQKAVQASTKYGSMLVSKGSVDEVDAISGATISYEEFKEAVEDALKKAEK